MPRKATGSVVTYHGRDSETYLALRFRASGRRHYQSLGAVSRDEAERHLRHIQSDIERGVWKPAEPGQTPNPGDMPTFHEYAETWWVGNQGALARHRSSRLPVEARNAPPPLLQGLPARPHHLRRRRGLHRREARGGAEAALRAVDQHDACAARPGPRLGGRVRPHLPQPREWQAAPPERADAEPQLHRHRHRDHGAARRCRQLDAKARSRKGQRRALLATLTFAELRIGEALALRWRDVDFATSRITVRASKADAGVRESNLLPVLRRELADYWGMTLAGPDVLVFGTPNNVEQHRSHIRQRVLGKSIALADERLAKLKQPPLPEGLTPHSLRRTFASILFAIGEPPPYVMAQMGHTTAELTLAIYAKQMSRRNGVADRLRRLVEDADPADIGQTGAAALPVAVGENAA